MEGYERKLSLNAKDKQVRSVYLFQVRKISPTLSLILPTSHHQSKVENKRTKNKHKDPLKAINLNLEISSIPVVFGLSY